jgi:hypothetical protein
MAEEIRFPLFPFVLNFLEARGYFGGSYLVELRSNALESVGVLE